MLFSPGWRAPIGQGGVLAVFAAGLLLGGGTAASVLWLLSGLSEPVPAQARAWLVTAVALAGLLHEAGAVRLPLPENARQIPMDVLQSRRLLGVLQFGFELGTGVRTYVSAAAPYVLALGLVLIHPGLVTALAAGAGFGAGRALTAALGLVSADRDWSGRAGRQMKTITVASMAAIAAATLAAAAL